MTDDDALWWVKVGDDAARRISPGGLLVGRFPRSDIVTPSPKASRRQALLYLGDEGPRLAVMGRGTVKVDGEEIDGDVELKAGSSIEVEDLEMLVVKEAVEDGPVRTSAVWVLETSQGGLFSFSQSSFSVGGSDTDDLRVDGLPEGALEFRSRDSLLELKPQAEVEVDGDAVDAGKTKRLKRGSKLAIGDVELRVVTGGELGGDGSTMTLESETEARTVRLEFLPRGGRLHVRAGGSDHSVYLTDRRCDFIAVLLKPPPPLAAGDYVPDEQLWSRVWGKQPAGKKTLHVLLHRLRKDLDRVGLEGAALLQRSEGGGATRFVLAPEAKVVLE